MLVRVSSHRDPEPLSLDAFERIAMFALRMEGAPDDAELSVALVDADEMAHLNEQYRGVPGATDVLAFGCDDPCAAGGDEPITLGDVIIAPDVAVANASEAGRSVEAELDWLLVHGVLHLMGYTHDEDDHADAMRARERAVLDAYASAG